MISCELISPIVLLVPSQVYFFNLTNAEDYFAGKSQPILVEVGPYTYL